MPMHILLLGNSSDTGEWFKDGKKRHEIAAERLEAEYGEPVRVTVRGIWPNPNMASIIAEWVRQCEPDVVYLNVVGYWFLYRSVPLRAERAFGVLGKPVGRIGFRLADSKRWGHNAVFRGIRSAMQRSVGGATYFTAEEVLERVTESVRVILRHEGVGLVLRGPQGKGNYASSRRQDRANEKARLGMHRVLESLAASLHVPYVGTVEPFRKRAAYGPGSFVGDGLHGNAERAKYEADLLYADLKLGLNAVGYTAATVGVD